MKIIEREKVRARENELWIHQNVAKDSEIKNGF